MIEQLQQNLKEFDEITDHIIPKIMFEGKGALDDIKKLLITHTISILEAERERLNKKLITQDEIDDDFIKGLVALANQKMGRNYAQTDKITYLTDQINKIREM